MAKNNTNVYKLYKSRQYYFNELICSFLCLINLLQLNVLHMFKIYMRIYLEI